MSSNYVFYISNGKQIGPVSMEDLVGKITPDTDVWCDGMPDWAKASTVPELAAMCGWEPQPMTHQAPQDTPPDNFANSNQQYYDGNSQNFGDNTQENNGFQQYDNTQSNNGKQQDTAPDNKPNNYLVLAILCTLICCWPFGIASIVNAAKVDVLWNFGAYSEAQKASDKAKKFAIISAVVAGFVYIIYFCIYFCEK